MLHPRPVRSHPQGPKGFEKDLTGRVFDSPKRRGKYLWLPFLDGDALITHLGMSGQLRINQPSDPMVANTRVLFTLSDGNQLRFIDQRMFGGLTLSAGGAELPTEVAHIAIDPFDPAFDVAAVAKDIQSRRTVIKRALLNQSIISGIGNIYADESLWAARVNYNTPTSAISKKRLVELLTSVKEVMAKAIAAGGTSFDALYVHVDGSQGYFERELNVYGRAGEPCNRCGKTIKKEPFMNRSSYLCTNCQRKRTKPVGSKPVGPKPVVAESKRKHRPTEQLSDKEQVFGNVDQPNRAAE